ncbi:MAG: YggS family pyridoxal phosphate-dependent enzyme [Desulfobacterales bacterium]
MKKKLETIHTRIQAAALSCSRDVKSIKLVAVSKTIPTAMIREAIDNGQTLFGENYIQEAKQKIAEISDSRVSWHFIGHLQSNKAKYAVKLFDMIHTVDSIKLADELNRQAKKINKIQKILLQVNTGMEISKSGIPPGEAIDFAKKISNFSNLRIKGIMTIPPFYDAPEKAAPYFKALRKINERIKNETLPNVEMKELSMGMTGDFEVAIKEGATLIRIGTAIFGART